MKRTLAIFLFIVVAFFAGAVGAQTAQGPDRTAATDFSGMYTFLQEGEFLQINLEDASKVTGYISRYGDSPSDKGAFLTQFVKTGKTDGTNVQFVTEPVHGTWFEFSGTVGHDSARKLTDEGYFVLAGKLTQYTQDANKKTSAQSRQVTFKSFPQDEEVAPPKRN